MGIRFRNSDRAMRASRAVRGRPRRGFVLPFTLLVIALATLVMSGVARRSLKVAQRASEAELQLQRKWGVISCQPALLRRADDWLNRPMVAGQSRDLGHDRLVFQLGKLDFDVLLADENAKVNLNQMKQALAPAALAVRVNELSQSPQPLLVELRPFTFESVDPTGEPGEPNLTKFGSWGQVFPIHQFPDSADAPRRIAAATMDLTCWGNGKLNLNRASQRAIQIWCDCVVGHDVAVELLKARASTERLDITSLSQLAIDADKRELIDMHFTDESHTYSMWVHVSASETRKWFELYIAESTEPSEDDDGDLANEVTDLDSPIQRSSLARFAW